MHGRSALSVGSAIFDGDKILLVKHLEKSRQPTGSYGLPGGRVENGETLMDACIRETLEETGVLLEKAEMRLVPHAYHAEMQLKEKKENLSMLIFSARKFSGRASKKEEKVEPIWVPLSDLPKISLLPNVREAIEDSVKLFV